jgi:hypothetical protein
MKQYKEHLPRHNGENIALCGEKRNPIVLDMFRDNDPDVWCNRCRKIACEDCGGTGIRGGGTAGIYCSCPWADYAMEHNGEGPILSY